MPYQTYVGYLDISCFDSDVTVRSKPIIVSAKGEEDASTKVLSLYRTNPARYLPKEVKDSHLTPNFSVAEVATVRLFNPQGLEHKV